MYNVNTNHDLFGQSKTFFRLGIRDPWNEKNWSCRVWQAHQQIWVVDGNQKRLARLSSSISLLSLIRQSTTQLHHVLWTGNRRVDHLNLGWVHVLKDETERSGLCETKHNSICIRSTMIHCFQTTDIFGRMQCRICLLWRLCKPSETPFLYLTLP